MRLKSTNYFNNGINSYMLRNIRLANAQASLIPEAEEVIEMNLFSNIYYHDDQSP